MLSKLITASLVVLLFLMAMKTTAHEDDMDYGKHQLAAEFIRDMSVQHGFEKAQLKNWFMSATKKQSILDAIARPAEKSLSWKAYRKIFVTDARINEGVAFWHENETSLNKATQEFGVPQEMIVAIIGVETFYGKHKYCCFSIIKQCNFICIILHSNRNKLLCHDSG